MTLAHERATESRNHRKGLLGLLKRVFRASVFPWLVLLAGCQSAEGPSRIITLAVLSSPNSLDPRIGSDETSQRVHQLVYDNLLALDDQLKVIGGLASSWEQVDPLTYVIHLRKGVRFHDGHELTAEDVVYTFGCFIDPSFVSPRKGAYRTLDRVEAI